MARIVSTSSLFPDQIARLEAAGHTVTVCTSSDLEREIGSADGLICMLIDRIDDALLSRAPRLRIVANVAVGYENVEVEAAHRRGMVVTNTPDVLTESTADLTFGLLLAAARRIVQGDTAVRTDAFPAWGLDQPLLGLDVHGKTLGIVGMGRIGVAVARRGRLGFGMRILYCGRSRHESAEHELDAERVSLDRLLAESDFVSMHVPLTDETRHLIDRAALERMKETAILVNAARGPVVDEAALVDALERGVIAGAGLDVYEWEPKVHLGLVAMRDRVVLTPHVGSATRETRHAMAKLAVDNVLAVLTGSDPITPVGG